MAHTSPSDGALVSTRSSLPDAGRGPALLGVVLIAAAMWMAVPQRLSLPGQGLNLGFTLNNAIFVVENAAMWGTLLLAVGATVLQARRFLVAAVVVAGVHLLVQVGTVVVPLVRGATPDLILGLGFAILRLVTVVAGLLVALLLRSARSARLVGLIVVAAGAVMHTLLSNVLLTMISVQAYGGAQAGLTGSLLIGAVHHVILLAVVVLVAWAAPAARRIGAVLTALLAGLAGFTALQVSGAFGTAYALFQILFPVLLLAAVVPTVIAARRVAQT